MIKCHDLHHRKGWKYSQNYGKQTQTWDKLLNTANLDIKKLPDNVDYINIAMILWREPATDTWTMSLQDCYAELPKTITLWHASVLVWMGYKMDPYTDLTCIKGAFVQTAILSCLVTLPEPPSSHRRLSNLDCNGLASGDPRIPYPVASYDVFPPLVKLLVLTSWWVV